jgi:tetratricopeptide (TPR) repeat protein
MKPLPVLLAAIALAACSHADPAAQFAQARSAFAIENYAAARDSLQAGLEHDSDNRAMLLLLVRSDLQLGDGEGAGYALNRLADLGFQGREWTELSAEAALWRGQTVEMERLLGSDHGPVAWRLRGEAAMARGQTAKALDQFRRGMAAREDFRLAWDYARLFLDADDPDEADRGLAVMRKVGPDRLDTFLTAGVIAEVRGQFALASAEYEKAARRFTFRVEPLLALAELADQQGDLKGVSAAVGRAVALAPADGQVLSAVLHLADEQSDWDKIRKIMAPYEASLNYHDPTAVFYADAMYHLGHAEVARAIFQQALAQSPQNVEIRTKLAACDLDLGDAAGALRAIRPVADSVLAGKTELDLAVRAAGAVNDARLASYVARRNSPALNETAAAAKAAAAAVQRRDWAAALAAWQRLPGANGDAQVLKMMALAASRSQHGDQAVAYADRALELDSANPDMIYMAGLVRLNAGRELDAARSLLRQALERDPNNRLFRAVMARAGG